MARPFRSDLVAWICSLPASATLIVCLFLPQVHSCNRGVQTPFDNHTAPTMIALACLGLLPLAWRWRPIRRPITVLVVGTCVLMMICSGIGIICGLVFAATRPWRQEEQLVAACSGSLVLLFVFLFPLVALFGRLEVGGTLTWAAAWVELVGMFAWAFAAARRAAAVSS